METNVQHRPSGPLGSGRGWRRRSCGGRACLRGGAVMAIGLLFLLTSFWQALAFSSDVTWFADTIYWWNAISSIVALFVAGLLAGWLAGTRGWGAGLLNGVTAWGLLITGTVVFGVGSAAATATLAQAGGQFGNPRARLDVAGVHRVRHRRDLRRRGRGDRRLRPAAADGVPPDGRRRGPRRSGPSARQRRRRSPRPGHDHRRIATPCTRHPDLPADRQNPHDEHDRVSLPLGGGTRSNSTRVGVTTTDVARRPLAARGRLRGTVPGRSG